MNKNEFDEFAKFLEMSEDDRFEYLTGTKLYLWQKLYIKFLNKWWSHIQEINPHMKAIVLWESIYKGRY